MCLYLIKRFSIEKEKKRKKKFHNNDSETVVKRQTKDTFCRRLNRGKTSFIPLFLSLFLSLSNRKRHDAIKISFDETNFHLETCPEVGIEKATGKMGEILGMPIKTCAVLSYQKAN